MPPRRNPPLRVVTGKTPVPRRSRKAITVKSATDSGVWRDLLVALRARIATDIDNPNTPARDLAALSRRLMEIVRELEALDAEARVDDIGEAAATPDEEWAAT